MGRHRGEDGVSEVIATILLVGVTVLLVGVVAIFFLSGPLPEEIPHASIVAKNESGNFTLAHEGGDPLRAGGYRIYIGSEGGLVDETANFTGPEGGIWLVGGNITYKGSLKIERAVVTVISGGSETILTVVGLRGGRVFDPDPGVPEKPEESKKPFIDTVIDEKVFVYGTNLNIKGGTRVIGDDATVVVTEGLSHGGGGGVAVSNIYVDGSVTSGGSASLGSEIKPGKICINGDLTLMGGGKNIYGDVYVNGNFDLKDVTIHGNVYVDGDLTLGWGAPTFADGARIYYTGNLTKPLGNYDLGVLEKCIHNTTVPRCTMPDLTIPTTKLDDWYDERGYVASGDLADGMKIFADNYSSTSGSAANVTIVAYGGDITISSNEWKIPVTGIFFAPKGKVTFNGGFLEGVVIAHDGFFVVNEGSTVTFKNITDYIDNQEDYPF